MKAISLFSGAGIGETYLKECGVDVVVANELIEKRANLYKTLYPDTRMICGDFTNDDIFNKVMNIATNKIDFLLASPPCQGMSIAGKNRCEHSMLNDERNYLITFVVKAIKYTNPNYILIENVPLLLKLKLLYNNQLLSVSEILALEFKDKYEIESKILDAADYGVPQTRKRAIIKMNIKGTSWNWPLKIAPKITVKDAIGHLPTLESGETSNIPWHFARKHAHRNVLWMQHTPTGKSAYSNRIYYPQHKDGKRIKGYESSYRRIKWDEPSPTITIRNDAISSQRNVHPGRLMDNGLYSDARVLTPLEIMMLSSLPKNWNIPDNTPEILIRQCIGESIPPLMLKKIIEEIL